MLPIVVAVVGVIAFVLYKLFSKKQLVGIPNVKGGYPFFGHVFTLMKGSPWDSFDRWVSKYGTVFKVHIFGSDAIIVSDPELLKVILQTKMNSFKKDTEWTYEPFLVLLGKGIVTSEGKRWLKQRTLLANHLKKEILYEIPSMALAAVKRLCVKLDHARDHNLAIDMAEEFRHLTLQVIAETILSLTPEESDETFATMYMPIVTEGNTRTWHPERKYIPNADWFKFKKDVATLNNYVTSLINNRWSLRAKEAAAGTPTTRKQDVLDKIMSSIPTEEWGEAAIEQIRDEIKTFVLAGHETTASMLAWTLYELVCVGNKEKLQIVREENKKVFAGHEDRLTGRVTSAPDLDTLMQLQYSEWSLREALRKYSVVPTVVRVATEDVQTESYFIPQGSTLMVSMQGVHHNPTYWPAPDTFEPNRFANEPEPYTFIPFIEGPRMCLGQYLSILEAKIVLSVLLSQYDFELVDEKVAGVPHEFMIPKIPKTGQFMKVHDRKQK